MAIATRLTDIYGEPVDRFMTAEQFLAIGERLPNAQLIDGEVVVNSPSGKHQDIVLQLGARLLRWVEAVPGRGKCGITVDVRLDGRNVYAPDLWWVGEQGKPDPDEALYFPGPPRIPDIAVEVLSPSTRGKDLGVKRARYEQLGLPELWVIDPKTVTATIWRRSAPDVTVFDVTIKLQGDDMVESPQLRGFAVRLADLFP